MAHVDSTATDHLLAEQRTTDHLLAEQRTTEGIAQPVLADPAQPKRERSFSDSAEKAKHDAPAGKQLHS